jgi:hypothetical protein
MMQPSGSGLEARVERIERRTQTHSLTGEGN